ncbi:MAG: hypothetical protein KBD64_03045 [Gammaproteobacteria bacterium]|nr:hypothetical protein [Gammaproteobacteria bacterium]
MKTVLSKLMILAITCGISLSSVAGWGLFNSHYDPYYNNYDGYYNRYYDGYDHSKCSHKKNGICKHKKHRCYYRATYKSVDRPCKKVRSAHCPCKKVVSISTFSKREMRNAPYQPMRDLYVDVFRGWF